MKYCLIALTILLLLGNTNADSIKKQTNDTESRFDSRLYYKYLNLEREISFNNTLDKLQKFSTSQALNMLDDINNIIYTDNELPYSDFKSKYAFDIKKTRLKEDMLKLRSYVQQHIVNNSNTSWLNFEYFSLQTILKTLMVITVFALGMLICKDVMMFIGIFFNGFVVEVLRSPLIVSTIGYIISFLTCTYSYDEVKKLDLGYLYIFGDQTCLLGGLIFSATTVYLRDSYPRYRYVDAYYVILVQWIVLAVYRNNSIAGLIAVMLLFYVCVLTMNSSNSYNSCFNLMTCFILSMVLNIIYLSIQNQYINIFETGIVFSTFIGSVSMLILGDKWKIKEYTMAKYIWAKYICLQCIRFAYAMGLIFLGFKGIGGTFLVLYGLDVEVNILDNFENATTKLLLGIILCNIYTINNLYENYPQYWILNQFTKYGQLKN